MNAWRCPASSSWNCGSALASCHTPSNSSSALISVSGTYWPPKAPNRPRTGCLIKRSSQDVREPNRVDKRSHLVRVLDAQRGLDPARNIDAVGLEVAHDLAHVTRFETAGDEYL